jgi:hypothetical protein
MRIVFSSDKIDVLLFACMTLQLEELSGAVMKLVAFTKSGASRSQVFINPDHVAYVRAVGGETHIFILVAATEGKLAHVAVVDKVDAVLSALSKA